LRIALAGYGLAQVVVEPCRWRTDGTGTLPDVPHGWRPSQRSQIHEKAAAIGACRRLAFAGTGASTEAQAKPHGWHKGHGHHGAYRHGPRRHYGWNRGHHYGWYKHRPYMIIGPMATGAEIRFRAPN
jgi:hypothetical protein